MSRSTLHPGSSSTTGGPSRRAFTLIEMLIALFVSGIILSALSSLVFVGTKAVPSEGGAQASAILASDGLERLASELSVAKTVSGLTSTGVTLTLADWTGDATDEVVSYSWAGAAGDPLVRSVNGGTGIALIPAADLLELSWTTGSVDAPADSTRGMLASQPVCTISVTNLVRDYVSASEAYGQRVVPSLPAGAVAWKPRTVSLWLARTGSSGPDIYVELRDVDDSTGEPGTRSYCSLTIPSGTLPSSLSRVDLSVSSPHLPATEDICVVVHTSAGVAPAETKWGTPLLSPGANTGYSSSDGGSTWASSGTMALQLAVVADVWAESGGSSTRTTLSRVRLLVEVGDHPVRLERDVDLLNCPEVLP